MLRVMITANRQRADSEHGRSGSVPFAGAQDPTGDDEERKDEDEEYCSRTDGHQSLDDESRVELDSIESSDTSRRRICKRERSAALRPRVEHKN